MIILNGMYPGSSVDSMPTLSTAESTTSSSLRSVLSCPYFKNEEVSSYLGPQNV